MITEAEWGPNRRRIEAFINRIEAQNSQLNALLQPTPAIARAGADAADAAESAGHTTGALHGMAIVLKDNVDTAGLRTTSGSRLYRDYIPQEDAEIWRQLRQEGAILLGKAGLHECVFGTTSQNAWFGSIRNPWDTARIPGGSSGGSGAAVAAEFCDLAIGTDTGGSVRIPAALCGVAGLRPTMGAVSNRGVRPISPHFDTVGALAYDVAQVAKVHAVLQGFDPRDETSLSAPAPLNLTGIDGGVDGLRIGIPDGFFYRDLAPEVEAAVRAAAAVFTELGAELVPVTLDGAQEAAIATARMIVAGAAEYYREALENTPEVFSEQVLRRLRTGFEVGGVEYAGHVRRMLVWRRQLESVFQHVDLILTPTLRTPAPLITEAGDLLRMTRDIAPLTMAWSLASVPNLALPCGFTTEGLPVSCQLAAGHWGEALLFRAGTAFQAATDFHRRRPDLLC